MNVFDFDTTVSDSHFNTLRILKFLIERDNKRSPIGGRGYVNINELISVAEEISIRRDAIYDSLRTMCQFGLIELDNQSKKDIMGASYVKITHSGKYYFFKLVYEFAYLDSIIVDTPIAVRAYFGDLMRHVDDLEIPGRLTRTEEFIKYLKESEVTEQSDHPEFQDNLFSSDLFADKVQKHFNKIKSFIAFNAQRRIERKSIRNH
jgi:hypothetical protein